MNELSGLFETMCTLRADSASPLKKTRFQSCGIVSQSKWYTVWVYALAKSAAAAWANDTEIQARMAAVGGDGDAMQGANQAKKINTEAGNDSIRARRWRTSMQRYTLGTRAIANDMNETPVSSSRKGVREILREFNRGLKLLWSEIGLARQTAARKRAGYSLTFHEQRLLRQVPRDVFKATPIVIAFMIPIVGSLAPLVSLVFPKALLPAQFWSWSQQRNYMMQDAVGQELSTFPALQRCLATATSPPRPNSTPKELGLAARWFANDGSLERLSRAHLLSLVRACNIMPPLKKASAIILPSPVLRLWLRQEAEYLSDDDLLLLQLRERRGSLRVKIHHEGENEVATKLSATNTSFVSLGEYNRTRQEDLEASKATLSLTPREIQVLCWERGLLRSAWDKKETRGEDEEGEDRYATATATALLSRLEDWLSLYDSSASAGVSMESSLHTSANFPGRNSRLPASMLLHAPALLRFPRP